MLNIQELPKDVLFEISKHLSIKEKHNKLGKVNKLFHQFTQTFVEQDKKSKAELDRLDSSRVYLYFICPF